MTRRILSAIVVLLTFCSCVDRTLAQDLKATIATAQAKVVKIYGAGGFRQLEAYQTGILISPDGHVLTTLSYVLDTDDVAVVLHDGSKWQAEYLGSDPITELALLKLPADDQQLPHFDLANGSPKLASAGQRILALSNLYGIATGDEPVSVLQGVITAIAPLKARRGAFQSNYQDEVYVLDAYANNPGAAGGALIDWQGRLIGVLGKELRSEVTGTWLNYALPISKIASTIDGLLAGRLDSSDLEPPPVDESHSTEELGIALVPDVLPRTPPYIDSLRRDSPADRAGLRPDDLVVLVNGQPVESHATLVEQLAQLENFEPVTISVLRGGELRDFELSIPTENSQVQDEPSDELDSAEEADPATVDEEQS